MRVSKILYFGDLLSDLVDMFENSQYHDNHNGHRYENTFRFVLTNLNHLESGGLRLDLMLNLDYFQIQTSQARVFSSMHTKVIL